MKKLILAVIMLCVVTIAYSQQSVRCKANRSGTTERCKMSTDDPDGYCHFHNPKHQCGVEKANGDTCKISTKNGPCKWHDPSLRCGAPKASGGTCGNPKATCQYHGE